MLFFMPRTIRNRRTMSASLPIPLCARLERLALESGRPLSVLLSMILETHLSDWENAQERAPHPSGAGAASAS